MENFMTAEEVKERLAFVIDLLDGLHSQGHFKGVQGSRDVQVFLGDLGQAFELQEKMVEDYKGAAKLIGKRLKRLEREHQELLDADVKRQSMADGPGSLLNVVRAIAGTAVVNPDGT